MKGREEMAHQHTEAFLTGKAFERSSGKITCTTLPLLFITSYRWAPENRKPILNINSTGCKQTAVVEKG